MGTWAGRNAGAVFKAELVLHAGLNEWERDVPTGSLELVGLQFPSLPIVPQGGQVEMPWVVSWEGKGGLFWYGIVFGSDEGRVLFSQVPAGELRLTNDPSDPQIFTRKDVDELVDRLIEVRRGEHHVVRVR